MRDRSITAALATVLTSGLANAQPIDGSFSALDTQLTCIYLPTAYGAVSPTERPAPESSDFVSANAAPLNAAQISAEKINSILANQARIDSENARMMERIAELEAELSAGRKADGSR